MKRLVLFVTALTLSCGALIADEVMNLGFVNFKTCVEISKQGVQEKNAFEALKNQMSATLEKTDAELTELAKKIEDQDYMDGLSPAAEEELKGKFQGLSQEFARYQNQYYQLLNQANYKMLQTMHTVVSQAAEKVRKEHDLMLILNEETSFAFAPSLNLTDEVIDEMDRRFESLNASETAALEQKSQEG